MKLWPYQMALSYKYVHDVINHMESYVNGRVHTNGIENFWSLLKRGIGGTYVAVEPFHLFRYVDEQVFRYNNRATADNPMNDFDRFSLAVSNIVGKRVTYAELTGKEGETGFLALFAGNVARRSAAFRSLFAPFLTIQLCFDLGMWDSEKPVQ